MATPNNQQHWRIQTVAQCLNENRIPCVLWGMNAMSAWGMCVGDAEAIEFVVPDHLLDMAKTSILAHAEAHACTWKKDDCPSTSTNPNPPERPLPDFHVHLGDDPAAIIPGSRPKNMVEFYRQSAVLWTSPIPQELSDPLHPSLNPNDFVLASDKTRLPPYKPHRYRGVHAPGFHPVLVPTPHRILEANLRLYARHMGLYSDREPGTTLITTLMCWKWRKWGGSANTGVDLLPPPLAELWKENVDGYRAIGDGNLEFNRLQWAKKLTQSLGEIWDPDRPDNAGYDED